MTTKIDWCDESANPFHGCKHACSFCYAKGFAVRFGGNPKQETYYKLKQFGAHPFEPCFSMKRLGHYYSEWMKGPPRRIFVGSMGDLGGDWNYHYFDAEGVFTPLGKTAEEVRSTICSTLGYCKRHTFLLLTKNPHGLANYRWPPNVHVGVSGSNPGELADRLKILFDEVKATVKWLSLEPLLSDDVNRLCDELGQLHWVVVGAQTGHGAPDPGQFVDCAKRVVEWCRKNEVPCFVKKNMRKADPDFDWPAQTSLGS